MHCLRLPTPALPHSAQWRRIGSTTLLRRHSPLAQPHAIPAGSVKFSVASFSPSKSTLRLSAPTGVIEPRLPFSFTNHQSAINARNYSALPDSFPRCPGRWSKWVAKLVLNFEDPAVSQQEPFIGSGFFVNIPGTERDILFTAGHNLINEHGALVHSVDVYVDGELISTVRVHGDDYHISESYIKTPNNTNPINDYGCILIKKREVTPKLREGFGFSLALADRDLRTMGLSAFVGGYPAGLNSPSTTEFRYAMGSFGKVDANQLHYHATTEKGQSGGPVWVLYKGYETVIGIHNHDQRSPGSGNRATRINIRTLYDMYRWAGVTSAAYSKPLKVSDYEAEPGLFLKFDPVTKSAVARLGTDGASTMFDLIPAHTAPTDAKREPRYAIINKPDLTADESKWHWLKFDVNPKSRPHQVTASVGKATEEGMVRFHSPTEGPELEQNYIKIEAAPLSSQALSGDEDRYLLRVEGRGMPSEVVENTKAESPDVLLVNITKNPALKDEFTDFQMQMNMPE